MTTFRSTLARIAAQEDLNFLLTNRIPRRLATRFIGWFSRIETPVVRDASIGIWRLFCDLDLSEAKATRFRSMHDCFIRELKDGARPVAADPALLTSPCDAIVGAHGRIEGTRVFQVKGFPYSLADLVPDAATVAQFRDGSYITLRLTAGMYHRFHAPHDCRVDSVTYIAGDTWNVNPIALKRIEALFCKNERAVVRTRLTATGHPIALVPVAAILVASLRFRFLDINLDLRTKGPRTLPCDATLAKGQEMGWFQHGSTIIVLAPPGFSLCAGIREGGRIRMGEPLMRLPVS
ncbi:archaetidylserine decarboxylase [Methylobacterium sp. ID0610]|uniref:archaetidylserine decarboxylase n=1 Tax=Methylobacterium carpenticola TaxID=3344827 RepID=UPI003689F978